jgi:membrane-associated phospholipid phosphatase
VILSYFEPGWRKALFFGAVLVSLSRIALADHFPLDVGGGAILGWMIGLLIVRILRRWPKNEPAQTEAYE